MNQTRIALTQKKTPPPPANTDKLVITHPDPNTTPITDQTQPLDRAQIEPKPPKPARPKTKKPELPTHARLPNYPATRSQKKLTAPDPSSQSSPNLEEHATQLLAEDIRHREELNKIKAETAKKKKRYFPF